LLGNGKKLESERLIDVLVKCLTPLTEEANALVILPNGSKDEFSNVNEILDTFPHLNLLQIRWLATQFTVTRKAPEKIPKELIKIIEAGCKRIGDIQTLLPSPKFLINHQELLH